jgi:hypothetical protein
MAQTKISIRFRFIRIPVTWEPYESGKTGLSLSGRLTKWASPEEIKIHELDAWDCRKEFFKLPRNDAARLVTFLNKVGVWSEHSGFDPSQTVMSTGVDDVWDFREKLRLALFHPKGIAPHLPEPKTLLDLITQKYWEFPFRFDLSKAAVGVVTMVNFRDVLWATVFADIAAGLRFQTCQRKDCHLPYAIVSGHRRKFCSQYCGHLVSQRRKRGTGRKKKST